MFCIFDLMKLRSNHELALAREYLAQTDRNIFLTGKAGTGKTTFLKDAVEGIPKRSVIVAPTGVAAVNAGGITIHSFFQLPLGLLLPGWEKTERKNFRYSKNKVELYRSLELLVIDEISMVRADVLDAMDNVLRRFRKSDLPFGGVQVLMIGDLSQLPPVARPEHWDLMRRYYETPYFFSSKVYAGMHPVTIELKEVFRQENERFIRILNEIRENRLSEESLQLLNSRYVPDFDLADYDGYILLTTHNAKADRINRDRLDSLKGKPRKYEARISGNFPENAFPGPEELVLKEGAQVMFIKNDPTGRKRFYNGKIGKVTDLDDETVTVVCEDDETPIVTSRVKWDYVSYKTDAETGEIVRSNQGEFEQFPLKLAWAVTIHKSQGLTFEKAVIDTRSAFAHGQTYVALSRCKSLEGLVLQHPVTASQLIYDYRVNRFMYTQKMPDEADLQRSKRDYQLKIIAEILDFSKLRRPLEALNGLTWQNPSAFPGDSGDIPGRLIRTVLEPLQKVAGKYLRKLELSAEQNHDFLSALDILTRWYRAMAYFSAELEEKFISVWDNFAYQTDNTELEKRLNELFDEVNDELDFKLFIFNNLQTDFNTDRYRRLAFEYDFKKKKAKPAKKFIPKSVSHPDLYEALEDLRSEFAFNENVPEYQIFNRETLWELSEQLPVTPKQLKKIKGIGKRRLEKYGDEIIELIKNWCIANDIPLPEDEVPKKNTREISLDYYLEGKSPEEIARIRQLQLSTVRGHLAEYIASGKVNVYDLISKEKLKYLLEKISAMETENLSAIKKTVGDDFGYDEIKIALIYKKRMNSDAGAAE